MKYIYIFTNSAFIQKRRSILQRCLARVEQIKIFGAFSEGRLTGVGVYLFLSQRLQLFGLALSVVFHDHHGSIDFAHGQVCGCWENDKLPWKIRPERDGTLSHEGEWEWDTIHRNTREIYNMQNTPAMVAVLPTGYSLQFEKFKTLFSFVAQVTQTTLLR